EGGLNCSLAWASVAQRDDRARRVGDPAEDGALRLDHVERGALELREVRADAVLKHDALVAAVVRLAHRRRDADLGRHAADDERLDAAVAQDVVEISREERVLCTLVYL